MKNADLPAFPYNSQVHTEDAIVEWGMTKREYFAAMAMQGLIAASFNSDYDGAHYEESAVASNAIAMADELLKQLDNEP